MKTASQSIYSEESRAKADAARRAQIEAGKRYRQDFLDAHYWRVTASRFGVRLPGWYVVPTPRVLRRYLKRVGITVREWSEVCAYRKLSDFARLNPTWPAWAAVGLILEIKAEKQGPTT